MHAIAMDPRHLPRPTTSLVGRTFELARLKAMLLRPEVRLVTLLGPGGVGKTRLAIHVAHEIDEETDVRVHLVPMANITEGSEVLPALARAVGASRSGVVPLEQQLADAIGDARMLLILDNVEQVTEDLTFLGGLLAACPNLTVLVTSRVLLHLSPEHVFPLDPLPTDSAGADQLSPAAALFVERARAVQPALDLTPASVRDIDAICRKVDGLPLAIELAAARTRFLAPAELRARLTQRLSMLTGGPRDAPERHRTLRATLAWSHDLLTTEERILFRRLGVAINGMPYEAIAPVCNAPGDLGDNVEDLLAALVDHSLVRIVQSPETGPRVRLLHTIREFAWEQLEASGEAEALLHARACWYAEMVNATSPATWRTGTPELRHWITRYQQDLETFSSVLEHLMETGETGTAVHMASQLLSFWFEMGQIREARQWISRLRPHAADTPLPVRAQFYRLGSMLAVDDPEFEGGLAMGLEALALAEELGDPRTLSNTQNLVGALYWHAGDAAEGERYQRAAAETMKDAGEPLGGALFMAQLGERLVDIGEFDRAEAMLREAEPIVARERPEALPLIHGSLGMHALATKRLDDAAKYIESAFSYHKDPPHRRPDMLAQNLMAVAELANGRERFEEGAHLLAAGLTLAQRVGVKLNDHLRQHVEALEAAQRAGIGDERHVQAMAKGRAMPVEDAIAVAFRVMQERSNAAPAQTPRPTAVAPSVPPVDLTPREREVLDLVAAGKSNAAIADALYISERTVTTHLTRLYAKLNVGSRTEAIAMATRMGLLRAA